MEDYAYILDYLPQGHPESHKFKKDPVAYAIGEVEFKLFELLPKEGVDLHIGDKVYIGKDTDRRKRILHVKRRVSYTDMTHTAQKEMPYIIIEIIKNNEKRFVEFFNEAQPINTHLHRLELIPGLGKKSMWSIIETREKKPFESFEDLEERVSSLHHPEKLIARRIELELTDSSQKYHLFVTR